MPKTTYEKLIEDPKRKEKLDKEYKELFVSEMLQALMEKDIISVRRLAQEADVSPTIIQGLKTGKRTNVTLNTLIKVLDSVGYKLSFEPKSKF